MCPPMGTGLRRTGLFAEESHSSEERDSPARDPEEEDSRKASPSLRMPAAEEVGIFDRKL